MRIRSGETHLSVPVKTVTLSEPDIIRGLGPSVPSPERKSNRQNVAIQVCNMGTVFILEKENGFPPQSTKFWWGVGGGGSKYWWDQFGT